MYCSECFEKCLLFFLVEIEWLLFHQEHEHGEDYFVYETSFVVIVSTFLPCALKSMLLFVAATIPGHQAPQTTYRIHARLYCSSIVPSFSK
jgi:hypothetical protein